MKHYTLQTKRGRGIGTVLVKADSGPEAKATASAQTGKDADKFFVKSWQEKGRGGKVLRERNYTTPLEQ